MSEISYPIGGFDEKQIAEMNRRAAMNGAGTWVVDEETHQLRLKQNLGTIPAGDFLMPDLEDDEDI